MLLFKGNLLISLQISRLLFFPLNIYYERDADCWWERNLSPCLKTYKAYKDVFLDIDESTLSEEEKVSESENVTRLRKEGLGSNYIYCPHWNS